MRVTPARVIGHGPARLIAVHGWMGDHRLFEPFFPHLDPDTFTCACLDCRGYGARRAEAGACTIEEIAADILGLAATLSWETFDVIGHSMAGMAAQRLMVGAPGRMRAAVLAAPVPASGARIDAARRELLRRAITNRAARRELIDSNTGRVRDAVWINELLELSWNSTCPDALERYLAAWTGTGFASEAQGSTVPVLAICGALDPGITPALMRETILAWYPNASLAVIENSGHYPMREAPAEFAALVRRFLRAPPR